MKEKLKGILFFSVIFAVADQVIKLFLSNKMIVDQSTILIKNLLSITLTHNTGAAFSIFSGSRYLLIAIALIAIVALFLYVKNLEVIDDLDIFIYSLLFGGILGNLIDRIVYGYVIDYISLSFGNYYFPIFNFADICIVLSIVVMILRTIKDDLWKE